jgi:hypothetical protein
VIGTDELGDLPGTAQSGIPTIIFGVILVSLSAAMGFRWHYRRKEHLLTQEFLRMMDDRYRAS